MLVRWPAMVIERFSTVSFFPGLAAVALDRRLGPLPLGFGERLLGLAASEGDAVVRRLLLAFAPVSRLPGAAEIDDIGGHRSDTKEDEVQRILYACFLVNETACYAAYFAAVDGG